MPIRITVLRHGQTTSNAAGIWQGHGDAGLSELGFEQAAAAAARLESERFDRVVSSDLHRAMQTAEALGRPVETDAAFREVDLGRWEGLTRDQVHARWPEEVAALRAGADIAVGGGESWGELEVRVRGGLEALVEATPAGSNILLVAHGGVGITLFASLLGSASIRPRVLGKLGNTSLGRLEVDEGRWRVTAYNDCAHVPDQASWRVALKQGRAVEPLPADPVTRGYVAELFGPRRVAELAPMDDDRVGLLEIDGLKRTLAAWNVELPPGL